MKIIYLLIFITFISIICLFIINNNNNNLNSSCIYDPITKKSYIIVEDIFTIQKIQQSLYNYNKIYHIEQGYLYNKNKKLKQLLNCNKENMKFMNKKYNTKLIN